MENNSVLCDYSIKNEEEKKNSSNVENILENINPPFEQSCDFTTINQPTQVKEFINSQKPYSTSNIFNPSDYLTMMQIGVGNFSELYMVEHKETKVLYTMKTFTKNRIEQLKKQEDVLMEKHVMNKISEHENLIKFYGCSKDEIFLYILYEYVNGGELWRKSVVYGLPSIKLIKFYFLQILDGISHMHEHKIIHRDIKVNLFLLFKNVQPENIMVTKDEFKIKIIDFGSCKDMEGTEFEKKFDEERSKMKSRKPLYKNFVGTPNYMAPECVRNKGSYYESDIWSLGCLLFQLFTGFPPFLGKSDYLIFQNSTIANYKCPDGIITESAVDLISKIIVLEPEKRISLDEIYSHPFLFNEMNDEELRNNYPIFELSEYAFWKMVKLLKNKYKSFKEISNKLDKIKNIEAMDEDCKRNQITPEKTEETEKEEKLKEEKPNLNEYYENGLNSLKIDIETFLKTIKNSQFYDDKKKDYLINKFLFLERQLKHDFFNITFEWF